MITHLARRPDMDRKEAAIRRCVSILGNGLRPSPYRGVTCILVADRLVDEVIQDCANAIGGGNGAPPARPYLSVKTGEPERPCRS